MKKKIITGIWVYPVKSFAGIRLTSAKVLPKGFEYDRRWMVIDNGNRCMTQRTHPQMALFKLTLESGNIILHYENERLDLPFTFEKENILATIWNDSVVVNEVSMEHSTWISKILGIECRLVAFPELNPRLVDREYSINDEHVSLADAYPFLIIGESSLDDLNRRMKQPLPMNRFRPNIVFSGGHPYEEDTWKELSIGKNRFAAVKLCSRCVLTTVDQDTGKKMGQEPLFTLSTYRRQGNNVYFGQNLIPIDHFEISEGDEIIQ